MKILCITSPAITGLNFHRQLVPFNNLEEADVEYQSQWSFEFTDEYLKKFEIVSFLRLVDSQERTKEIYERIKGLGLKIHFDIDDYWVLPVHHNMYEGFKKNNIAKQVIEGIKGADLVTCTTPYLAEKLTPHNDNVHVLPNAINPREEQWQRIESINNKVRFGYIAGVHHNADIEILKPGIDKLFKDRQSYGKFQLCPAGFNMNNHNGKLSMNPYYHYVEQVFTNNYGHIKDKEYKEYLKSNNPQDNEQTWDKEYRRLWGLDCFNYGKLYNLIDVSLVPLHESWFSSCKSELKLIEAGFMKKACIVSNVRPYDLVANEYNSIRIKPSRNEYDWFVEMRNLCKEPERIKDLGEALHESVKVRYHIDTVNVERKQILERLCE